MSIGSGPQLCVEDLAQSLPPGPGPGSRASRGGPELVRSRRRLGAESLASRDGSESDRYRRCQGPESLASAAGRSPSASISTVTSVPTSSTRAEPDRYHRHRAWPTATATVRVGQSCRWRATCHSMAGTQPATTRLSGHSLSPPASRATPFQQVGDRCRGVYLSCRPIEPGLTVIVRGLHLFGTTALVDKVTAVVLILSSSSAH